MPSIDENIGQLEFSLDAGSNLKLFKNFWKLFGNFSKV